jgi:hypothetical protein
MDYVFIFGQSILPIALQVPKISCFNLIVLKFRSLKAPIYTFGQFQCFLVIIYYKFLHQYHNNYPNKHHLADLAFNWANFGCIFRLKIVIIN